MSICFSDGLTNLNMNFIVINVGGSYQFYAEVRQQNLLILEGIYRKIPALEKISVSIKSARFGSFNRPNLDTPACFRHTRIS
jgi:hypothetical protein